MHFSLDMFSLNQSVGTGFIDIEILGWYECLGMKSNFILSRSSENGRTAKKSMSLHALWFVKASHGLLVSGNLANETPQGNITPCHTNIYTYLYTYIIHIYIYTYFPTTPASWPSSVLINRDDADLQLLPFLHSGCGGWSAKIWQNMGYAKIGKNFPFICIIFFHDHSPSSSKMCHWKNCLLNFSSWVAHTAILYLGGLAQRLRAMLRIRGTPHGYSILFMSNCVILQNTLHDA